MGRKDKALSLERAGTVPAGAPLRYARQDKNVSLTEMAVKLGYSKSHLSAIENGDKVSEELVRRYEEALHLAAGTIDEIGQALQRTGPAKRRDLVYIPYKRNTFFTGRQAFLESIHNKLLGSKTNPHALAITGLAGIGKTQVVIEYSYQHCKEYQIICWLNAASQESLTASCVDLANALDLPERNAQDPQMTIHVLQRWLQENSGSLIVLDNVDDPAEIADFLAQLGENYIILTTRTQLVGTVAQTLELEEMSLEEGILLLLRQAKVIALDETLAAISAETFVFAQDIAEAMAGLPLALSQAGSYIEKTACGLPGYLALFKTHLMKILSQGTQIPTDYPTSVATTLTLAFEKLQPASVEFLYLCAFLDPERIATDLIIEGASVLDVPLAEIADDLLSLNQMIGELRKYSLIRGKVDTGTLSIHRLLQMLIRSVLGPEAQYLWAERTMKLVNQAFPLLKVANWHKAWSKCQRYFPQVSMCVQHIRQFALAGEEVTELLNKAGKYLEARTQFADAEQMYLLALKLDQQCYGKKHATVVTDCVNLAQLYGLQRKYDLSLAYYQDAFALQKSIGKLEQLDAVVLKDYIHLLERTNRKDAAAEWNHHTWASKGALRRISINDDDAGVIYNEEGAWVVQEHEGDFNGDDHFTNTVGATFQYTFTGIGIEIIANIISTNGELEIYIDDLYVQTVNTLRLVDRLTQTIIFSKTDLETGRHTLKVVLVKGAFALDALAVFYREEA